MIDAVAPIGWSRSHRLLTPRIYRETCRESWQNLPHCRPFDHTMFDALDEYVAQKLPTAELYQALVDGRAIEVHGIYPEHLLATGGALGYSDLEPIAFASARPGRALNFVRPRYFTARNEHGEPVMIVAVTPGRDYVRHYAGLVRHYIYHHTNQAEDIVSIIRYPEAEATLPAWTGLANGFVVPGDVVVLGYVRELLAFLREHPGVAVLGCRENDYYWSTRLAVPGGPVVNLVGVKFSFWGTIAATLCQTLCEVGVSEILYLGKLGALSSPLHVYTRIFCPSHFVVMDHRQVRRGVAAPPNGLLRRFPGLDTGCHVSVPTVLEEDYLQRHAADELAAASIDNEISQMACTIVDHNRRTASRVRFAAVHFATDYIRKQSERHMSVQLNLSTNRTAVASERKAAIIERICREALCPYLTERGRE
jgi:hypothetical protein